MCSLSTHSFFLILEGDFMDFNEWYDKNDGAFFFSVTVMVVFVIFSMCISFNTVQNSFLKSINYDCSWQVDFFSDVIYYDGSDYVISCDNAIMDAGQTEEYNSYMSSYMGSIFFGIVILGVLLLFFSPYLLYLSIKVYNLYFRRKH